MSAMVHWATGIRAEAPRGIIALDMRSEHSIIEVLLEDKLEILRVHIMGELARRLAKEREIECS